MLKVTKVGDSYHIFDTIKGSFFSLNRASWDLIKAIKKYGPEKAAIEVAKGYDVSEKTVKKDIDFILNELEEVEIDIQDIPLTFPDSEYAPRSVEFDITPRCNSKCIYCMASDRMKNPTLLPKEKIIQVIDDLNDLGTWSITLSGGEPTLREDLFEILDHLEKLELAESVFSNGITIDKQLAKKFSNYKHLFMQISLDSANPKHHDLQRGVEGAFDKTLQGIKNLLEHNIFIEIATIITPINIDDIDELAELVHSLKIRSLRISPAAIVGKATDCPDRLKLSTKQLMNIGKKIELLNKKYKGSLVISKSPHMVTFSGDTKSNEPLKKCGVGKNNLYIAPNGLVYPCMLLAFPEFELGDIKKDKLSEIWHNSPILKKLRELSIKDLDKCGGCKVKNLCNGGCRGTAYIANRSIKAPDPIFCSYFGK